MNRIHDVIVLGGGPAGSTLALRLAREGFTVLVCERGVFPRPKLCGEFLSPEVARYLRDIGAGGLLDHGPARAAVIDRVTFHACGVAPVISSWPEPAFGLTRVRLDHALFEKARAAGAECRERCRVRDVRRTGAEAKPATASAALEGESEESGGTQAPLHGPAQAAAFEVESEVDGERCLDQARIVVDARGHHHGPRRERSSGRGWTAFERHYRGAGRDPGGLDMFLLPGGYCGVNPVEEGTLNVCFLLESARLGAMGSDPDELLGAFRRAHPALEARLRGWDPIEPKFLAASGDLVGAARPRSDLGLSVGDAAGSIAPLCGDGIAMALRSAELASREMTRWFHHRGAWSRPDRAAAGKQAPGSPADAYERAWRSEFTARRRLGGWLHATALHPRAGRALLGTIRVVPPLADWLIHRTRAPRTLYS